ncbi:uncharacterized protein LOC120078359 isoform X2 [Benincasa hispida]|uniref:uncharacterized protein LOC120078359 isoform X2 n=1 Tax=Benincasa hispida TaxID=102211 RepID=UPI001900DDFC|nr:uncharacterized protein LOC120078359 isoform X2 [Benincasa hispida]
MVCDQHFRYWEHFVRALRSWKIKFKIRQDLSMEKEDVSASTTYEEGKKKMEAISVQPILKERVSENVGKDEEVIAISVLPILKEKALKTMSKDNEVISSPSNLSISLKSILSYAKKVPTLIHC